MANAPTPVSQPFRFSALAWVAVLLGAVTFLVWTGALRARRVEYVSATAEQAAPAGAQTRLIVPGHENASYEWLDQTQQMFAQRTWRVRHIDYENAPYGRAVDAASPYRWWLGAIAWIDRSVSGRPISAALERAALIADPLLLLLLLIGGTIFVAWQFGAWPAALLAAGAVTLFPFGAGFLPGAPDDAGLGQVAVCWSVLLLLAGARAAHGTAASRERSARRWFFLGGIAGGLGLWIGVAVQAPVLGGIALGGLLAAWVARGQATAVKLPWLAWALGGATATFAGYLAEYFPAHLGSWELRVVHPLYGLAWLGGGALLAAAAGWVQGQAPRRDLRTIGLGVIFAAAFLALPFALWRTHSWGFLDANLPAFRLTRLPGDTPTANLWAWLIHDGLTPRACATLAPAFLILPAAWLIWRRRTALAGRVSLAIALLPMGVAMGFAGHQLSWWHTVDALLLVLLVAATAAWRDFLRPRLVLSLWAALLAAVFLLGAVQVAPSGPAGDKNVLDESEILGLVERDLARWLAVHAGPDGAVILAPHNQTVTLYYYGGVRGLATLSRENLDGLGAAIRIVSASTLEEAKELIDQRGVTHIIIPSWDNYLDAYTRMGIGKIEGTFFERITNWRLPPWLKPVPYQLPVIPGFEGQSVKILEVVEDQDDAAALSRTAEYFVEMGDLEQATAVAQVLRRYPADLGALTARAQVDLARGDRAGFDRTLESLRRRLTAGADRGLPWDRRASLAVVLARAKLPELAREQVRRCLAEADDAKLRSLTTVSLFRLQVLGKAYSLAITDQRLRDQALELLPADLRSRL